MITQHSATLRLIMTKGTRCIKHENLRFFSPEAKIHKATSQRGPFN